MTITKHVYAYFEDSTSKAGKTGLADVAFYIKSVKHSDSAIAVVVNGTVGFEVGYGIYGVQVAGMDLETYDYIGAAQTASTATTSKAAPLLRWDAAESHDAELANLDAAISSRSTLAAGAEMDLVGGAVDDVWDELIAGHVGAGSVGAVLNAAGAAGDPWSTQLPGAYPAGSAGRLIGDNAAAIEALRISNAAVLVSLTTGPAGLPYTIYTHAAAIITLTGLPSISGYEKLWFTIKRNKASDDTEALIHVEVSDPPAGTDGLIYVNGAGATNTDAAITVLSNTSIQVVIEIGAMEQLGPAAELFYGVKKLVSTRPLTVSEGGKITIASSTPHAVA